MSNGDDKPENNETNGGEKAGQAASGVDLVKLLGPSIVQATGNIIGGYFSGQRSSDNKVEQKVNALKDSSWFHWILLIGIGVIALGAFIDGLETIYKVITSLFGFISNLFNS